MSTTVSLVAGTVCWEPADPVYWPEEKPGTFGFRKPTFVNAVIFAQAQVLFLGSLNCTTAALERNLPFGFAYLFPTVTSRHIMDFKGQKHSLYRLGRCR